MPLMVTVEESVKPVAEAGLLDIVVPYTTPRLTRLALREAQELALKLPSRIMVLFLTRDPEGSLLKTLRPGSIVVIASEKRWWRTAQERLQRICERHGHQVALIYSR